LPERKKEKTVEERLRRNQLQAVKGLRNRPIFFPGLQKKGKKGDQESWDEPCGGGGLET